MGKWLRRNGLFYFYISNKNSISNAHAASNAMYRNIYSLPTQFHASHLTLAQAPDLLRVSSSPPTVLRRARKLSFLNLDVLITMDFGNTIYTIRSGDSANDILDTHHVAASSDPVEGYVSEDVDKADQRHNIGDSGAS
jgi:hypothetical protein